MNDKKEITRLGRGLVTIVAITLLLGTLLPFLGKIASADKKEIIVDDASIANTTLDRKRVQSITAIKESDTNLTSYASPDNTPLWNPAGNVYGLVKYKNCKIDGVVLEDLPLRDARVRIFNVNPTGDNVDVTYNYGTVPPTEEEIYTTDTGYFSFYLYPQASIYSDKYYVVVYSDSHYAQVKDSGVYTNRSDNLTVTDAELAAATAPTFEFTFSSIGYPYHPAWNILDNINVEAELVKTQTGYSRDSIEVYYPIPNSESSHNTPWDTIEFNEISGWNDNTIYHEYAHAIMHTLYQGNDPSSDENHNFARETTLECCICEGWAEFIANFVGGGSWGGWDTTNTKTVGDLEYGENFSVVRPYAPSYRKTLPFGDAFEDKFDNNHNGIQDYDIIEGNFAGILWDIIDNPTTYDYFYPIDNHNNVYTLYDDESYTLNFASIWNTMANKKPFTIHDFWDGWFTQGYASTNYDKHWIKAIYYNHGVKEETGTYPLPEHAPDQFFMGVTGETANGIYNGTVPLWATSVFDSDVVDWNFLRCRFEYYQDTNGNGLADDGNNKWITFSESEGATGSRTASWDTTTVLDGHYLLRAVVDDDMIETIDEYSVKPILVDNNPPPAPELVTGPLELSDDLTPTFVWKRGTDISGITQYWIGIGIPAVPAGGSSWESNIVEDQLITNIGLDYIQYQSTELTTHGQYFYQIKQQNGAGLWSGSQIRYFQIETIANPVTNLMAKVDPSDSNNIVLTWTKSSDDPSNLKEYRVYRATSYLGPYYLTATLPAGAESWNDIGAIAIGITNDWFYAVESVNMAENTAPSPERGAKVTLGLQTGWNFVSIPLLTADTATEIVLSSIMGDFNTAIYYNYQDYADAEKQFVPTAPPNTNDLTHIDYSMGFWVYITQSDAKLITVGTLPNQINTGLHAGWQQVGYTSLYEDRTLLDELAVLADQVEIFDSNSPYHLNVAPWNHVMKPFEGFSVHCTADCVWTVNNNQEFDKVTSWTDTTPPTTIENIVSTSGLNGYMKEVKIKFFRSDDISGVSGTYYQLPAIDSSWHLYDGEFSIPESDDSQQIKFYSKDKSNNVETIHTLTVPPIDHTPPSNPTSFPSSHTINVPSNDYTIYMSWSGASDSGSGVYGYSIAWSTVPNSDVNTNNVITTTSTTSDALTGGSWYFYIRTMDYAGNWANVHHIGPFIITPGFNRLGYARASDGITLLDTQVITAWIDGVEYGRDITDTGAEAGAFSIDTVGDSDAYGTISPIDNVKNGGYDNIDTIRYVKGDLTTASAWFAQTDTFVSGGIHAIADLIMATTQPALLKISSLSTASVAYIGIYNPTGSAVDVTTFSLAVGTSTPQTIAATDIIDGTNPLAAGQMIWLKMTKWGGLSTTGNAVKLSHTATGYIVDRVEYGTINTEPKNTKMTNAPNPLVSQEIRRTPFAYTDTNSCSADFTTGARHPFPPAPPPAFVYVDYTYEWIYFIWSASYHPTGVFYQVYVNGNYFPCTIVNIPGIGYSTSFFSSPQTTYYIRVEALSGGGGITTSEVLSITTPPAPPPSGGGGGGGGGENPPSCPYIYVWNGTGYTPDNSLLTNSEDFDYPKQLIRDYYLIQKESVPEENVYKFRILESELYETSYIDQLQLITVDYNDSFNVGVTLNGDILTYTNPVPPVSCIDDNNTDVTAIVAQIDEDYFGGYYGDYLISTFEYSPSLPTKLIIRSDYKCPPGGGPVPWDERLDIYGPILISVLNENNDWTEVGSIVPRELWSTDVIDLTGYLPQYSESLNVKLSWTSYHKLDYIGLYQSENGEFTQHTYDLSSATMGQSNDDVLSLLSEGDENYLELSYGQYVDFTFPYIESMFEHRDLILYAKGYYTINLDFKDYDYIDVFQQVNLTLTIDGSGNNTVQLYSIRTDDNGIMKDVSLLSVTSGLGISQSQSMSIRSGIGENVTFRIYFIGSGNGSNDVQVALESGGQAYNWDYTFNTQNGAIQNRTIQPDSVLKTFYESGAKIYYAPHTLKTGMIQPVLFKWSFGNGTFINNTEDEPQEFPFTQPGNYSIRLTIVYENDATATLFKDVTIPNIPPVPIIEVYQEVELTLQVAGRKDNTVTLQVYEEGALVNETTITRQASDPKAQTKTITMRRYLDYFDKNYTIVLVYDAAHNGENPIWLTLTSGSNVIEYCHIFNSANGYHQEVILDPSYLKNVVQNNTLYYFDASESYDVDGEIVNYTWVFRDSEGIPVKDDIGYGVMASHQYPSVDNYTISLTVTDNNEATVSTKVAIFGDRLVIIFPPIQPQLP